MTTIRSETISLRTIPFERRPERYLPDWASYAVAYVPPLTWPPAPVPWLGGAIPDGALQAFGGASARDSAERFARALAMQLPTLPAREAGYVAVYALKARPGSRRPLRVITGEDSFCYIAIDGGGILVKDQSDCVERYGCGHAQEGALDPSDLDLLLAVRAENDRGGALMLAQPMARDKRGRAIWDRAAALAERGFLSANEYPANRRRTAPAHERRARLALMITIPGEQALIARGLDRRMAS